MIERRPASRSWISGKKVIKKLGVKKIIHVEWVVGIKNCTSRARWRAAFVLDAQAHHMVCFFALPKQHSPFLSRRFKVTDTTATYNNYYAEILRNLLLTNYFITPNYYCYYWHAIKLQQPTRLNQTNFCREK